MAQKVTDPEVSYLRKNIAWIVAACSFLIVVAGAGGAWGVTTYRLDGVETRVTAIEIDRAQEKKDNEKMRRNILRLCVSNHLPDCEN